MLTGFFFNAKKASVNWMSVNPAQAGRDEALLVRRSSGSMGIKVMGGFIPLPSGHVPITEPLWSGIPPSHANLKNHDMTSWGWDILTYSQKQALRTCLKTGEESNLQCDQTSCFQKAPFRKASGEKAASPLGFVRVASVPLPPSPQRVSSNGRHWSPVPAKTSEFFTMSFTDVVDLIL